MPPLTLNFDVIQLVVAAIAAVAGYLLRGRQPGPPLPDGMKPGQYPLLELLLKLLAERFKIPAPGPSLPAPQAVFTDADVKPAWAAELLAELRAQRKTAA